jgi:hypothetical protein
MNKLFQLIFMICLLAAYLPVDSGMATVAYAAESGSESSGEDKPEEGDEEPECE